MQPVEIKSYKPQCLTNVIERIWIAKASHTATNMLIMPTQFVNIVFPLSKDGMLFNGEHYHTPIIQGVILKPNSVEVLPNTKVLSVRLYCYGLYAFEAIECCYAKGFCTAKELTKIYQKIAPELHRASCTEQVAMVTRIMENFYCEERETSATLVKQFYRHLVETHDTPDTIEAFCKQTNIGYITLNRAAAKILKQTPKKFERLIKFRKSLDNMVKTNHKFTNIAIEVGYFDQPHFVREFKYFMGTSPSDFLKTLKQESFYHLKDVADFSTF